MPLKFGSLGIPEKTYFVRKTGFPFYDACQLVGAMHLFFGGSVSKLSDNGAFWVVKGQSLRADPEQVSENKREEHAFHVGIMRNRLLGRGLERVEQTTLTAIKNLELDYPSIHNYFKTPNPEGKIKEVGVSRYLEPSYLTGARGSDASGYGTLASQRGVAAKRPEPEIQLATIGLTQAAIAYGNDEVFTVLPVFKNTFTPIMPFKTYNRTFRHRAGGQTTAVYASLSLYLTFQKQYPIIDFAYAYHGGRGFYHAGLLGLNRLCEYGNSASQLAKQTFDFLNSTNRLEVGLPVDLARELAHFAQNSDFETLNSIVSMKARLMANDDQPDWLTAAARKLFADNETIKEVLSVTQLDKNKVPPPSEAIVKALGEVFRAEKEGRWIAAYVQLERAHNAERFYDEVGKILSRAMSRADGNKDQPWLFPRLRQAMATLSSEEVLDIFEQKQHFAAHKLTFLLRVLGAIQYQPKPKDDTADAANQEDDDTPQPPSDDSGEEA